jgi:hypothetical protein
LEAIAVADPSSQEKVVAASLKMILALLIASDRASCSPGNPTLYTGSELVLNIRLVDEVSLEHFFRLTHVSSGTKIADDDFFTVIPKVLAAYASETLVRQRNDVDVAQGEIETLDALAGVESRAAWRARW